MTNREAEVAELVRRGYSNKRIGSELGISPLTVRTHISNVAKRMAGDIPARRKLMLGMKPSTDVR
jgi:DNA-binding NarL/FixJ family response regulator